jgi:hypothetical protein
MSKKVLTEIICDTCNECEYISGLVANHDVGLYNWVRYKGKYFCNDECKANYYAEVKTWMKK